MNGSAFDYRRLAELHRPTNPASIAKEVRRLATQGLTPTDISTALRIDLVQVRQLLSAVEPA